MVTQVQVDHPPHIIHVAVGERTLRVAGDEPGGLQQSVLLTGRDLEVRGEVEDHLAAG